MVNSVFQMLVRESTNSSLVIEKELGGSFVELIIFWKSESQHHKEFPIIYSRPTTFTTNESLVVVDSLKHGYLMLIAKKKNYRPHVPHKMTKNPPKTYTTPPKTNT